MPTPQEQEELDKKKAQEEADKTALNEDDLIDDDEEETDDDEELDDLEDDILEMSEEDLKNPENQKKALDALGKVKSVFTQKKVWRDRALAAGYSKEAPPKKESTPAKPPAQEPTKNQPETSDRLEFRMDHSNLSRRQVDQIEKYAKANGMSLEKAYKQPLIQRFVKDSKKKDELLNSSPSSQHRGTPTTPPKDWTKATRADVEQRRREIAQGHLKSR